MVLTKPEIALKAIAAAERRNVPPGLVCAIIEISSGWDASLNEWHPAAWLLNQHPVDWGMERWNALGTRWGPMQILGQDAHAAGYKTVEKLADLDESLDVGCMLLKGLLGPDVKRTMILWFGAERKGLADKVLAVLPQFEQFIKERPCESYT